MTEAQAETVIQLLTEKRDRLEEVRNIIPYSNALLGAIFVALLAVIFFAAMNAVKRSHG